MYIDINPPPTARPIPYNPNHWLHAQRVTRLDIICSTCFPTQANPTLPTRIYSTNTFKCKTYLWGDCMTAYGVHKYIYVNVMWTYNVYSVRTSHPLGWTTAHMWGYLQCNHIQRWRAFRIYERHFIIISIYGVFDCIYRLCCTKLICFLRHMSCVARPSVQLYVINHVTHPCSTYRWLSTTSTTLYIKYKLFRKYKKPTGRSSASYDKLSFVVKLCLTAHNACSKMQIFFLEG